MRVKIILYSLVLLSLGLSSVALTKTVESADQFTYKEALALVRTINTVQAGMKMKGSKFGSLAELLKNDLHPRQRETVLNDSSSGSLKDYKLSVVVSADGQHYQVSLRPASECGIAFFSSDSGVIYEGRGLGCPGN